MERSIARLEQYYEIQEYKYRVEREAQESTRKQIEANGIAAFQRTVSEGISDSYLRWRGIEATLALAQSRNSKVVVIGGGKDGLPIILGNVGNADNLAGAKAAISEDDLTSNEKTSPPTPGGSALVRSGGSLGSSLITTDKGSAAARSSTPPDVTQATTPPDKGVSPPAVSNERSGSVLPDLSDLKSLVPKVPDWLRSGTSGAGPAAPPKQ